MGGGTWAQLHGMHVGGEDTGPVEALSLLWGRPRPFVLLCSKAFSHGFSSYILWNNSFLVFGLCIGL